MKVFLDIDGVLVPANSWRQPEILKDGFPAFDTSAVQSLQRLLSSTGAEIVLTTSHKDQYSLEAWRALFSLRGLNPAIISRLPDNVHHLSRKDELLRFFDGGIPEGPFVIIDDDESLNDLEERLKRHLVLTSSGIGLTPEQADDAIAILCKEQMISM